MKTLSVIFYGNATEYPELCETIVAAAKLGLSPLEARGPGMLAIEVVSHVPWNFFDV